MAERRMFVEVRPLSGADQLSEEDGAVVGTWGLTLVGGLAGRPDPAEAALDVFHLVVPVSSLDAFEIEAFEAGNRRPVNDLGRFSRLPDPPFANLLLDDAFGPALRAARPDVPRDLIVYEVDGGEPDDPNTVIWAAVFDRGILDANRMIGEPISLTVSKEWLAETLNARVSAEEGPEP